MISSAEGSPDALTDGSLCLFLVTPQYLTATISIMTFKQVNSFFKLSVVIFTLLLGVIVANFLHIVSGGEKLCISGFCSGRI